MLFTLTREALEAVHRVPDLLDHAAERTELLGWQLIQKLLNLPRSAMQHGHRDPLESVRAHGLRFHARRDLVEKTGACLLFFEVLSLVEPEQDDEAAQACGIRISRTYLVHQRRLFYRDLRGHREYDSRCMVHGDDVQRDIFFDRKRDSGLSRPSGQAVRW